MVYPEHPDFSPHSSVRLAVVTSPDMGALDVNDLLEAFVDVPVGMQYREVIHVPPDAYVRNPTNSIIAAAGVNEHSETNLCEQLNLVVIGSMGVLALKGLEIPTVVFNPHEQGFAYPLDTLGNLRATIWSARHSIAALELMKLRHTSVLNEIGELGALVNSRVHVLYPGLSSCDPETPAQLPGRMADLPHSSDYAGGGGLPIATVADELSPSDHRRRQKLFATSIVGCFKDLKVSAEQRKAA